MQGKDFAEMTKTSHRQKTVLKMKNSAAKTSRIPRIKTLHLPCDIVGVVRDN